MAPTIPHMSRSRFLLRPSPARNRLLLHARQRKLSFEHFARDGRARSDRRPAAYRDRGDKLRVRADEYVVFDDGPMLVSAVVVAGDRAGADVHVPPDARVADVGEVIRLRAVLYLA